MQAIINLHWNINLATHMINGQSYLSYKICYTTKLYMIFVQTLMNLGKTDTNKKSKEAYLTRIITANLIKQYYKIISLTVTSIIPRITKSVRLKHKIKSITTKVSQALIKMQNYINFLINEQINK